MPGNIRLDQQVGATVVLESLDIARVELLAERSQFEQTPIVAIGAGPPSRRSRTDLFAMSMTTTASGSVKSNATTSPVPTSLGPISASSKAVSKMPPMYFLTSAASLNPIVLLNLHSIKFSSELAVRYRIIVLGRL